MDARERLEPPTLFVGPGVEISPVLIFEFRDVHDDVGYAETVK
jgi:hypothetical protein